MTGWGGRCGLGLRVVGKTGFAGCHRLIPGVSLPEATAGSILLHPPSVRPQPLDPNSGADSEMLEKLHASLGDFFAERIASDSEWARAILSDEASVL